MVAVQECSDRCWVSFRQISVARGREVRVLTRNAAISVINAVTCAPFRERFVASAPR